MSYDGKKLVRLEHLELAIKRLLKEANTTITRDPVDLTSEYSSEISKFDNVWDWVQFRAVNQNWDDIIPGDYIPLSIEHEGSAQTYNMEVAGIDTSYGDYLVPHHIDFVSRELSSWTAPWGDSSNNGDSASPYPWVASKLREHLNSVLFYELPEALQNVIIDKYLLVEGRYSEDGVLASPNGWGWTYLGGLWVPTEIETFGVASVGSDTYGGYGRQYPVFEMYENSAVKAVVNGSDASWYTLSPQNGSSTGIVIANASGAADSSDASVSLNFPICFRVGASK